MSDEPEEPLAGVKTKIVATIGPASSDPATLRRLIRAGVDVFRLNFSHGTHEVHAATLESIRVASADSDRAIGVLMDLSGPKLRLGEFPNGSLACERDAELTMAPVGSPESSDLTCDYPGLIKELTIGETILFADGAVSMTVTAFEGDCARLRVTEPGVVGSRQGINIPGSALGLPSITEKDLRDLDWAATHPVDFIALSFVRSGSDLRSLRAELERRAITARIIAKIEKPQALDDLDAILGLSDALMIARGDLGVEVDVTRVPAIQKQILRAARHVKVPVITATQMLASMEHASKPTRAEASDVFNAVIDGTDAVMLSGETAVGEYPVETVRTMSRILAEAERATHDEATTAKGGFGVGWISPITEAVVEAGGLACRRLGASLMVVVTRSGRTAIAASMLRSATPTIAIAHHETIARQLSLLWGVVPLLSAVATDDPDGMIDAAVDWAMGRQIAKAGDRVVILKGFFPDHPSHNTLVVREIGASPRSSPPLSTPSTD